MKILFSILFVLTSGLAQASFDTYSGHIQRHGQSLKVTFHNWWVSEYPGPVIKVMAPTTLNAVDSVRAEKPNEVACSVEPGTYHPWSAKTGNLENFYTLSNYLTGTTQKDLEANTNWDEETNEVVSETIPQGTLVYEIAYLSEGFCHGKAMIGDEEKVFEFGCFVPGDFDTPIDEWFSYSEQWISLQCNEGYRAFIQDESFLMQENVTEGEITGYGEVQ